MKMLNIISNHIEGRVKLMKNHADKLHPLDL